MNFLKVVLPVCVIFLTSTGSAEALDMGGLFGKIKSQFDTPSANQPQQHKVEAPPQSQNSTVAPQQAQVQPVANDQTGEVGKSSAPSIDDILNKSPPTQVQVSRATSKPEEAYTTQDIINKILEYRETTRDGSFFDRQRMNGFNKENFGSCSPFYIGLDVTFPGSRVFNSTIDYLFRSDKNQKNYTDADKEYASKEIQSNMSDLLRAVESRNNDHGKKIAGYNYNSCKEKDQYMSRLKDLLNAVINAGPAILAEQNRLIMIKKQDDEKRMAANKERERVASERENKLAICQNSNEYKIYDISNIIVADVNIINNAQQQIDRQNEGAKISGYVDKGVMYNMGQTIAQTKIELKQYFDFYKSIGGSAPNASAVIRVKANPCH